MADVKEYWSNQIPAPETKKRLDDGDKKFSIIEMSLNDMKNQIENFSKEMQEWKTENAQQHRDIMAALKEIKTDSVSQVEFLPIRKLVYGAAGVILTIVLTASVYLIIKNS